MKRPARNVLRLAGRLAMLAVVACAVAFVTIQFAGIIKKNLAMAHEVGESRTEIAELEARERRQQQTLRRLSTPEGAVPEIHAKLRLVGPHEEIIYVRGSKGSDAVDGEAPGI